LNRKGAKAQSKTVPVIASGAKQSRARGTGIPGLPRRYAPRNDDFLSLRLCAFAVQKS
jgi:hypothetical protein